MIGDNLATDIAGASRMGYRRCWSRGTACMASCPLHSPKRCGATPTYIAPTFNG